MKCEVDVLRKAADLIEPEGSWCQRVFVNVDGAHCAVGALEAIHDTTPSITWKCVAEATKAVERSLEERGITAGLVNWNDRLNRQQSEVVALFREVANKIEQE